MFDFKPKDLQALQQAKIKNELNDFPVYCNYLYIFEYQMLFISKSRNKYRVVASSACHFEPVVRTDTFDILFFTNDLDIAISIYRSYLFRLFHSQDGR